MENTIINKQKEIVNLIINKSLKDSKFKDSLILNPKEAINNCFDNKITFKDKIKLVVEDQSDENIVYLNIPRNVGADNYELSEEELEKVAGGATTTPVCVGIAVYVICEFVDGFAEGVSDRLK